MKKKLGLQTLVTTMSQYTIISKRNKICQWQKMHLYSKVWRDKFQWKKGWCTEDLTTTCIQIISIAYYTSKGKNKFKNFTKEDTEQLDNKYKNYVTKLNIDCKYTWLLRYVLSNSNEISKSSPCTSYRNNIAINQVNIRIHYHQLLNHAPYLQTTFISKLNKGKTNYGIGVITYSHIQQSTTFTPKNELLQDQNFNYRISKTKTLQNKFFFSKDRKRKLIKKGKIFDNEIKKGGRKKKLIIKMSRSNHVWGWL